MSTYTTNYSFQKEELNLNLTLFLPKQATGGDIEPQASRWQSMLH